MPIFSLLCMSLKCNPGFLDINWKIFCLTFSSRIVFLFSRAREGKHYHYSLMIPTNNTRRMARSNRRAIGSRLMVSGWKISYVAYRMPFIANSEKAVRTKRRRFLLSLLYARYDIIKRKIAKALEAAEITASNSHPKIITDPSSPLSANTCFRDAETAGERTSKEMIIAVMIFWVFKSKIPSGVYNYCQF